MTSILQAPDGTPLQLHRWPAPQRARGRLLVVHGLGEHGARYADTATALNRLGWEVHGWDHRGHGASGGARGSIPHADALLEDAAAVIDHLGPGPLVLLGHSMGGAVAARFVAEALRPSPAAWSRRIDALVLSSPALDLGLSAGNRMLLAVLGALAPNLAISNGLNPQWVSRDPEVVAAYTADPLVHDRVTARLVRFMVDAGTEVRTAASQWRTPTLLMWAGADRLVAPAGSAAMAAAAPPKVLAARCFESMYHEILNDPQRGEVLAHLGAWLAGRPTAAA